MRSLKLTVHAVCMPAARATRADFDGQFSEWYSGLWPSLAESLALSAESTTVTVTEPRLRLTMENKQTTNPVVMSYRAHPSTLMVNRELLRNGQSATDSRSARHIELELPAGMEYQTGDHLGVLPRNNVDLIRRVMARFGLDAGTYVTINPTGGGTYTHLPLGEAAPLLGILGACVELQDVASRSDLAVLARYATDPEEAEQLQTMSGLDEAGREAYRERVATRRRSVLELLDDFPAATCRSMSTWSCCHPCGLATTPSPPPPRSRAAAISRSVCSMVPPAAVTATSTGSPRITWEAAWRAAPSSPLYASRPSLPPAGQSTHR